MSDDDLCGVLVLPGIYGSGPTHWQTAWEQSIEGARRVQGVDWDIPICTQWVDALEGAVAQMGPQTVLVAHSLGCLQVAHWALRTTHSVRGALLVAPPDPDGLAFPSCAVGWRPLPPGRLPFPSVLVASRNDPFGSFAFARGCATAWGSHFVDVGERGHINVESGAGVWDEGRPYLNALVAGKPG